MTTATTHGRNPYLCGREVKRGSQACVGAPEASYVVELAFSGQG
jgi:hypothetical protein